jgi:hypothetical protein
MERQRILKLSDKYYAELVQHGVTPIKMDENKYVGSEVLQRENHVAWACLQVKQFVAMEQLVVAQQWIGFIQGALWDMGWFTIEEMRQHDIEALQDESVLPQGLDS